ncbi:MAG: hybrid sensor histidine kinase/response regulator [Flavobacterium sp.]|nr:hybrid sensor histidine kinase/response regulator [Pedobacter sp.]
MADAQVVKILLVDDNENNLLSMEIILEKEGYAFFKALSGKDALKILLKEDDFSLILLDVRMPIMDGYETAELICQRDKLKHIPIIFITGQDYEDASVFRGYKTGAVDYIRKPVNPQILRSKVGVFAELYKKNQLLQLQEEKLIRINDDLMLLNQNLEKRVFDRTAELENLNHELKSLNLSKDKFLSVISHDLRNPLTALLISSDHLIQKTKSPDFDEIQPWINMIHRTSNKILQQLNELVRWAETQREKITFKSEKLNLLSGVEKSLELLQGNFTQKKIVLNNKIPSGIYVHADPLMLRSILQNLFTNSIKFTPEEGSISIIAQSVNRMIEISITDTGIGMDEYMRENLFTNFNSASLSGTNSEKGSGLGLMLVKDFVTQNGGTIRVKSEKEKGTCVTFTVPEYLSTQTAD